MSRIAVISPHLDDAVFSVGEHMLSRPDDQFTIVTPCGSIPAREPHRSKYRTLLAEHAVVCSRMGWEAINGLFLDDAAAADEPDVSEMEDCIHLLEVWLSAVLRDLFDEWWVPMGIYHPDHVAVSIASQRLIRHHCGVAIYEELPYRVRWPNLVSRDQGWTKSIADHGPLGPQLQAKRRLCNLYASQIGPDIERHLYADERLWR